MFAAPPAVTAKVFTKVPESLRVRDNPVMRFGVARDCFLEGPSFDRAGNLYCVDIYYGRIFRIDPKGDFEVVTQYEGRPNGLKIDKEGRIFIADHTQGLLTLDPASGKVTTVLKEAYGEPFKGLNDLVFATNGDLYFTDQGATGMQDPSGRVFCLRADGRLDILVDNVPSPNGIALSPDEHNLYVAATRSNTIWNLPLAQFENGVVRRVGIFTHMNGGTGPDGLAVSAEGHVLVAHVGFGAVWVYDDRGIPVLRIDAPAGRLTTNMAFGGPDRRSLFITESSTGTILRAELPFAGATLYSHR
jgi:gluconolactonase